MIFIANTYTYLDFAYDIIELAKGEQVNDIDQFTEKAQAFLERELKKQEKVSTTGAKSKASEETMDFANELLSAISETPKTAATIAKELDIEYVPLKFSNALRWLERNYLDRKIVSRKISIKTTNVKGVEKTENKTAFYFLD